MFKERKWLVQNKPNNTKTHITPRRHIHSEKTTMFCLLSECSIFIFIDVFLMTSP